MKDTYKVNPFGGEVDIKVRVPGSKSITNRAFLLAALADGESVLEGVGLSDDSRVFMEALTELGFDIKTMHKNDSSVSVGIYGTAGDIPVKNARVYVASAGTAARFLTAMLALSDGCYTVDSSEQMKARPMRELIEALEKLGAGFEFMEEEYALPFKVFGRRSDETDASLGSDIIPLNIDRSSQFLSALLLCGPMVKEGFKIKLTGTRQARSYVEISEKMMRAFGYGDCELQVEKDIYEIKSDAHYQACRYEIEPDVSAACYFYAMAAINGGKACVYGVHPDSTQGDIEFLSVLKKMGCEVTDSEVGMVVSRSLQNKLSGLEVDMSDFSDQTMTLAAVAPFANGPVTISGVAHIRGQESDRISAITTEMKRIGIRCDERDDGLVIFPVEKFESDESVLVETYNDHRIAMSFAVLGTGFEGIVIDNPGCCRKTFEGFFDTLDSLYKR